MPTSSHDNDDDDAKSATSSASSTSASSAMSTSAPSSTEESSGQALHFPSYSTMSFYRGLSLLRHLSSLGLIEGFLPAVDAVFGFP